MKMKKKKPGPKVKSVYDDAKVDAALVQAAKLLEAAGGKNVLIALEVPGGSKFSGRANPALLGLANLMLKFISDKLASNFTSDRPIPIGSELMEKAYKEMMKKRKLV